MHSKDFGYIPLFVAGVKRACTLSCQAHYYSASSRQVVDYKVVFI